MAFLVALLASGTVEQPDAPFVLVITEELDTTDVLLGRWAGFEGWQFLPGL